MSSRRARRPSVTAHGLVALAALSSSGCRAERVDSACGETCGARAYCDEASARCFCEVGSSGDPEAGCEVHDDLCGKAQVRLGHSVCRHEITDRPTWTRLSIGHGKNAALSRAVKYVVPAVPDARLPVVFGDTNWFRTHHCLIAQGFEPLFPGATYGDYLDLVIDKDTREYYGGTISELSVPGPEGQGYVFTVETFPRREQWLSHDEIYGVYRTLQDRFGLGGLSYTTDTELHLEQAQAWVDPPFPVLILPEPSGPQYEAYTPGLAYGRVRRFTNEQIAQGPLFGWRTSSCSTSLRWCSRG